MADMPLGGAPPPQKRERRPAGTTAAHLENICESSGVDLITTPEPVEELSATLILNLEDWGRRVGIAVVPVAPSWHLEVLISAGATAWIAVDYCCCSDTELAIAIKHATHVITAGDDIDRFHRVAADLAADGGRVLLLEWPEGTPLPLPRGGG